MCESNNVFNNSIKTAPTQYIFLTTWYVDKNVSKAFKLHKNSKFITYKKLLHAKNKESKPKLTNRSLHACSITIK